MLTTAFGALWVAGCPQEEETGNCPDGTVYRVNPATARVTARVHIGANVSALAADESSLWVGKWKYVNGLPQPAQLFRLDPHTLELRRYSLEALRGTRPPCCVRALAAGEGAVWMTFGDRARLVRLDRATGRFTRADAYGSQLVAGEGAVWIEGRTSPRVPPSVVGTLRIDPVTIRVAGIGPVAASVTAGNGAVWVVETSSDINDRTLTLERLDPVTARPTGRRITVEAGEPKVHFESLITLSELVHLAHKDGVLWITVGDSFEAIQITPV